MAGYRRHGPGGSGFRWLVAAFLATGLLAGINLARLVAGDEPVLPPSETMLGALLHYVHTCDPSHFQPMNANFGLLPPLERKIRDKRQRRAALPGSPRSPSAPGSRVGWCADRHRSRSCWRRPHRG